LSENPNPTGPQDDPAPKDDPKPDEPLGEGGKKALDAEREARKAADAKVGDLQKQIDDLTKQLDGVKADGLPEWQQQINELKAVVQSERDARVKAEGQAQQAMVAQLRLDRANTKGLPAALAKKLTGTTAEELDAEIDELLPLIGSPGPKPNPQQGNPSQGRGGSLTAGRERFAATNK